MLTTCISQVQYYLFVAVAKLTKSYAFFLLVFNVIVILFHGSRITVCIISIHLKPLLKVPNYLYFLELYLAYL